MAQKIDFHETFSRPEGARAGSERTFGLLFAGVFVIVAFWPLLEGAPSRAWAGWLAVAFAAAAVFWRAPLRPLNRLWFRFGMGLHKVVSPVVMAGLFYLTVTPTGLLMRLLGKRPVALEFDPAAASYWIRRDPLAPETMRNQF